MDSNTTTSNVSAFKDILLRKLSYAVICSVISQVIVLFMFLFVINFNIFEPLSLLKLTFQTFSSLNTWIYIIPFSCIIFAQGLVCAKDYVLSTNYYTNRIEKFLSTFSLRNLVLLTLYVLIGGLMVWLFLTLSGGQYQAITSKCTESDKRCINEGTIFLILSGMWTGLYYFIKIYNVDKRILFPVIYEHKLMQMKMKTLALLNESHRAAAIPTIYFVILYQFSGIDFLKSIINVVGIEETLYVELEGYTIYFYMWLFTILYFLNMNLMRFSFELFLTEPVEFPILKLSDNDMCLADAIGFTTIPIIQHLACLDLYVLSQWSRQRRQILFSLSQPGGHPHNWNYLITNIIKLITNYCECLNKATTALLHPEILKKVQENVVQTDTSLNAKYGHIRNITAGINNYDIVNISQTRKSLIPEAIRNMNVLLKEKMRILILFMRKILGIDYLFGELPEANIQYCLGNAQIIMWATQGLSSITIASLIEDRYGIVQKDLPAIITTLAELKNSLEKLNRVPTTSRKSVFNDGNVKMKNAIIASVKRSLFGISHTFGQYLKDIPMSKEILQHLQLFVPQKTI